MWSSLPPALADTFPMPFIGSIIPQKVAAPQQTRARGKSPKGQEPAEERGAFTDAMDQAELSVTETGELAGERRIAEAASEDSAEDRQSQVYYGPDGAQSKEDADPSSLDVSG